MGRIRRNGLITALAVAALGTLWGAESVVAGPAARQGSPRTRSYVSEPNLHPPLVKRFGTDTDRSSGDIFLDARYTHQQGPLILNPQGDLVWFKAVGGGQTVEDVREQAYRGKPVITYWQGHLGARQANNGGIGIVLNRSYRRIATIRAGGAYARYGLNEHELTLTPSGTALASVNVPTHVNLSKLGGPLRGTVLDCVIQEIDVATGHVVWQWRSLGHIPLRSSYLNPATSGAFSRPWDPFHLNSIQQLPGGKVLISMRNTWGVYEIDQKTGHVVWQLGGKRSSFKVGAGAHFEWQHDAELHGGRLLTVFDDAAAPAEAKESRALKVHLDFAMKHATLKRAYRHRPPVLAGSQGNVQLLPDGNVFVGWGAADRFSEYTAAGRQLFSGRFASPANSYRAYRFPWTGDPTWAPAIAARRSASARHDYVYASWNGSTEVVKWQVLGSKNKNGQFAKLGAPARRASFQTRIRVAKEHYFKVEALDSRGQVLPHGISRAVTAAV